MTYHRAFDRLGNLCYRRSRKPLGHAVLQTLGAVACVVALGMLVWVR